MTETTIREITSDPRTGELADLAPSKILCARCIYDEETPGSEICVEGDICRYCQLHDQMEQEYPTGEEGERVLCGIAEEIRKKGKRGQYDVIVGVSGGCDSSFMLWKAKDLGLRPLAVHFDNTWNSQIATENIHNVLKKLDVDLYTHVVDNEEYNDIYRAFMLSGVPDIEAPTDIALAATLYKAAAEHGIKYIFEGHSFRTEGVSPLGWLYMDGKYIDSVVRRFGNYRRHRLRTFPNLTFGKFLKHMLVDRVKKIRPLYWIDYDKESVKKFLASEFGWKWYGGHHLENRFTAFYHSYFLPRRFEIDQRPNGFSALVRTGQMTRQEAIAAMRVPPAIDPEIIDIVKRRLRFSDMEFEMIMNAPKRSYKDFKTYKSLFEKLRPFFYLMYRMDMVPKSFYVKYTTPDGRLEKSHE